jgi:hypothetical protein
LTVRISNPEFDLICAAAGPNQGMSRFRELLHTGLDEQAMLKLAAQHGVRPALIRCLAALSWKGVSQGARDALEGFRQDHLLRSLSMVDELLRLAATLARHGVLFASFKGPVLALELYGDIAQREYADLDIIVPVSDLKRTEHILASMDYAHPQGDLAYRHWFLSHQRQYALVRPGLNAAVDLHWAFAAAPLPFPLNERQVWQSLGQVELGSRVMPVLGREDLALLLAGHGTKEAWRRLTWVVDFAMLAERWADLDWPRIHIRAQDQGCGDSILLAFAMATGLLGTPVPAGLCDKLYRNHRVQSNAARLISRMRATVPDDVNREPLEDALLCDRQVDRLKAWVQIGLTPTAGDHDWLPLPARLWCLYYLLRPLRLVAKALFH